MTDHQPSHQKHTTHRQAAGRNSVYVPINRAAAHDKINKQPKTGHQPKQEAIPGVAKSKSHMTQSVNKLQRLAKRITRKLWQYVGGVKSWWQQNDQKYQWKWRTANLAAALLILFSALMPLLAQLNNNKIYELSSATLDLVGKTNTNLASKLSYDSQKKVYQFNKDAVKESSPVAQLQKQVGGTGKDDKSLYSLDVQEDMSKGVTYYDTNSQLSFKLLPQFSGLPGKITQDRIVFPLRNDTQAIYTLKNNGLKEDIVVQKATKDTMSFSYTLELPKTLEARTIPNSNGNIGIYSASPTLFGNISYGSDADKAAVNKARENATKDTLVFGIPAPVITKSDKDKTASPTARFQLEGNKLTVIAEGLRDLTQPFSIDPSVVVTSTSDFAGGNNEGNIDFNTADQIGRGGLTGGVVNTVVSDTSCGVASVWCSVQTGLNGYNGAGTNGGGARHNATMAYNGFLYSLGGNYDTNSKTINTVSYAPLNATTGTVGSWTIGSTLSGSTGLSYPASTIYGGYIYAIGGQIQGGNSIATIQYALICTGSNSGQGGCGGVAGSVGTWTLSTTSTNFTTVDTVTSRGGAAAVAYNGYMYVMGGMESTPGRWLGDVIYAPILASGDLGNWIATTSLPSSIVGSTVATVYNGKLYVAVSCDKGSRLISPGTCTATTNLLIGSIATDGSISGWTTGPAYSGFATLRYASMLAVNGYLYVAGGSDVPVNTVTYAPIYANGSVGVAKTTSPLATTIGSTMLAATSGYLYLVGGNTGNNNVVTPDTQYAKIDPPGAIAPYTTGADFDTAGNERSDMATVASNGYLYLIGGFLATGGITNTVRSAPINADGTLGAWTNNTSFTDARRNMSAVAYGTSIYVVGGQRMGAGTTTCLQAQTSYYCQEVIRATIDPATGTLTWSGIYTYSTQGRASAGTVVVNDYLYVLGGRYSNNSRESDEINYAHINADGTLGAFATTQHMLDKRSLNVGAYAWGGRIYAIAGFTNGTSEYATPLADGTIPASGAGSWAYTGGTMPFVQQNSITVGYNGYIYVTGGNSLSNTNGSTYTQIIKINSDGTLGTWVVSPQNFTQLRFNHGAVAHNGYLYIIGGCKNGTSCSGGFSSILKDVQIAKINNGGNGDAGTWTSGPTSSTIARHAPMAVASSGYMIIMGGCNGALLGNCTGIASSSTYATINVDGSLGSWTTGTTLPITLDAAGVATANGYVYLVGGCSAGGCSTVQNTVYSALICTGTNNGVGGCGATGGTLGTWNTLNTLSSARWAPAAVAANGYLYVSGGQVAGGALLDLVQSAQILPNGGLGLWGSAGSGATFSTARLGHNLVNYGGYLYILGGGTASANLNDVQSAQLQSNGQLSAWSATTSMPMKGILDFAGAANGYMYFHGTIDSGTITNKIMYAPISGNGKLGQWSISAGNGGTALNGAAGAIYNGFIYRAGGFDGNSSLSQSSYYAPLQSIPRVGIYSKLLDLGIRSNVRGISYNGSLPGGLSAISYKAGLSGSAAYTNTGTADSSLLTNARCTGLNGIRYLLLTLTIDDSQKATFPDDSTTQSNVTDLSVLYEPSRAPNQRLRLGQTLQSGTLSDLDVCKL